MKATMAGLGYRGFIWWGILLVFSVGVDLWWGGWYRPVEPWRQWATWCSQLGDGWVLTGLGCGIWMLGIFTVRWLRECGRVILVGIVLTGLITFPVKVLVGRARPYVMEGSRDVCAFRPLSLVGAWQSFPSGHTAVAWTTATVLRAWPFMPRWIHYLAYGLAGLVGMGRVVEGSHHPTDVLGGAGLGIVLGQWAVRIRSRRNLTGRSRRWS